MNPRLAGGMIPALVDRAAGVDLVAAAVARAAGDTARLDPRPLAHASIRFALAGRPGTVTAVGGPADARALPGVEDARITVTPGTVLRITHSFRDRFGYAIATGPGRRHRRGAAPSEPRRICT